MRDGEREFDEAGCCDEPGRCFDSRANSRVRGSNKNTKGNPHDERGIVLGGCDERMEGKHRESRENVFRSQRRKSPEKSRTGKKPLGLSVGTSHRPSIPDAAPLWLLAAASIRL